MKRESKSPERTLNKKILEQWQNAQMGNLIKLCISFDWSNLKA